METNTTLQGFPSAIIIHKEGDSNIILEARKGDSDPEKHIERIVHRYNLHPQILDALEELHDASLDNDQERMYQARADAREIISLATGSEVEA